MNRRGFTFIELVTVWAIICILAAILFPVFAKAREKARQSNCLTNLINVGTALRMYAADHWGYLPPTQNDLTPLLNPRYLPEPASLTCPTLRGDALFDYPPKSPEQQLAQRSGFDYVYRAGLADDDAPQQGVAADRFRDVHNDGGNALFLDGHAKWMNAKMFEMPGGPNAPGVPPGYGAGGPAPDLTQLGNLQVTLSGRAYLDPRNDESRNQQ
jgi:prepilin-type N-terminal cleavage/methylation domain-containing protein/prepilin-type processing-associated H-X9-DG protein